MTFQAHIDTIRQKTGKSPDDFVAEAAAKGLLEPLAPAGVVKKWLADEYGLGAGHSMAVFSILKDRQVPRAAPDDRIAKIFAGAKGHWRPVFDALLARLDLGGAETSLAATDTYVSLLRGTKKFAVAQFTADRFDLGLKLTGEEPSGRFEASGSWNAMVTLRVRLASADDVDDEVYEALRRAYDAA
ncbi:DUF5655 domain-containing protein [Agreia sp.]|uniref:DUF5655 domain-containing protein n=1 Tax=Agreia sp. TaxID=1872416 RepID=UPI0035BC2E70